jgi:hypothetical protein
VSPSAPLLVEAKLRAGRCEAGGQPLFALFAVVSQQIEFVLLEAIQLVLESTEQVPAFGQLLV